MRICSLYQACSHIMVWSNFPVMFFWDVIGKIFYEGNTDQMFGLIPVIVVTFVMWWIFLGLVLGTILYWSIARLIKR